MGNGRIGLTVDCDVAFDTSGGADGNLAAKFAQSHGRPFHPLFQPSSRGTPYTIGKDYSMAVKGHQGKGKIILEVSISFYYAAL